MWSRDDLRAEGKFLLLGLQLGLVGRDGSDCRIFRDNLRTHVDSGTDSHDSCRTAG